MRLFRHLSLALFLVYLAVFPGSTVVVALDRVPAWGGWMGGALLLIQGAAALCWLIGYHGRRGALAGLLVFALAWAVEHIGVLTRFPFGHYQYTELLQPQLLGVVPLPIACAWVMVAIGAWQLATHNRTAYSIADRPTALSHTIRSTRYTIRGGVLAATLVLLLDLQIETVATKIHPYWVWLDGGRYYGVPTANFVAWWLVGLGMALIVNSLLQKERGGAYSVFRKSIKRQYAIRNTHNIPAYLYILSTIMFTVVNLARGYVAAGLVGAVVLLVIVAANPKLALQKLVLPSAEPTTTGKG
jgi:bisanhydrobacterioruberin hydratase